MFEEINEAWRQFAAACGAASEEWARSLEALGLMQQLPDADWLAQLLQDLEREGEAAARNQVPWRDYRRRTAPHPAYRRLETWRQPAMRQTLIQCRRR